MAIRAYRVPVLHPAPGVRRLPAPNAILADPVSVARLLGFFGWVVAMLAAAVAFRRAGAGWPVTLLIGFASLFAVHPPPVGPVGLFCFAAAAVLVEGARARGAKFALQPEQGGGIG
jgi:hypothetical protein